MKNLSTMHKRILGVIFTFAAFMLVAYVQPVKAIEYCKSSTGEEEKVTDATLVDRYGISVSQGDNNKYTVSMNPSSNKTERCKMEFTITRVNNETKNLKLTCANPVELTVTTTTENTATGLESVIFVIEGKDIIKNENQTNSCYYKSGALTYEITANTTETVTHETCPTVEVEKTDISVSYIDCNKVYAAGSFQQKFCYAKSKALAAGKSYTEGHGLTNGIYSGTDEELTFKCNAKLVDNDGNELIPTDPEKLKGDDYFINKYYVHGSYTKNYDMGQYTYHYAPGVEIEGDAISCEITCEEAVEVEFGPPVASHAGACFEYKVRVTSRVSCNMTKTPPPPDSDCSYRTPTPYCVHFDGTVYLQGGPNEAFDACVKSCDGGKYTKKCSNKCFKTVYGQSAKINKKVNNDFLTDVYGTRLANYTAEQCYNLKKEDGSYYNYTGCYYVSGGSIGWAKSGRPMSYGSLNTTGEGRWYTEHQGGRYHSGAYIVALNDGFWRRNYGSDFCHDNCSWLGNYNKYYLNPGLAEEDYKANIELYNEAVVGCRSKASCKTEKAEYTISADYTKKGETTVTHIDFPYNSDPDMTQHVGERGMNTADQDNTTLLVNYPCENNGIWGCYSTTGTEKDLYRTTWGFPGSWKNLKTGEITFVPVNDKDVWYPYEHSFCVPGDAKSVNALWWNAYKHKEIDDRAKATGTAIEISANTDEKVVDECQRSSIYSATTIDYNNYSAYVPSGTGITWNIHAKAINFGYFGWNIQMDCFYALNDDPVCIDGCCVTDTCGTPVEECNPGSGYRIRSTDLEDLFPDPQGGELATAEQAGRQTGFNWSQYAYNTKNPAYPSNPVKYMQEVQKAAKQAKTSGTEFYSNDKLDYEFNLSPKVLRNMRKDAAGLGGSNYTAFADNGFKLDINGVGRYKSDKIRELEGDNKYPKLDTQLCCNNMINWSQDGCDPVHN